MTDAYGCVALVAMAPIISIEIMGLMYRINTADRAKRFVLASESIVDYGYRDTRRLPPRTKEGGAVLHGEEMEK